MTLRFSATIGHRVIGNVAISRLVDLDPTDDNGDEICPYQIALDNEVLPFVVDHRYGDGAWVLIGKAMAALDVYMRSEEGQRSGIRQHWRHTP